MYFGNSNPEIYIFCYFTLKLKYSKMPFICLFSHLVSFATICPRHGELDCLQNELMNLLCQWEFINNIHDIFKSILLCSPFWPPCGQAPSQGKNKGGGGDRSKYFRFLYDSLFLKRSKRAPRAVNHKIIAILRKGAMN